MVFRLVLRPRRRITSVESTSSRRPLEVPGGSGESLLGVQILFHLLSTRFGLFSGVSCVFDELARAAPGVFKVRLIGGPGGLRGGLFTSAEADG